MICNNEFAETKCAATSHSADGDRECGKVVKLGRRGTSSVRLAPGQCITARARAGTVWVTMEGDDQDYALRGGEIARFSGAGLLVVEGLSDYNELVFERVS